MKLEEALKNVAVIGAAGKMGSGISLLLLQEMAKNEAKESGQVGSGEYTLMLIDANVLGLQGLRRYLRTHLVKYAEKEINRLRDYYKANPKLVSNEEMIRAFVEGALDIVRFENEIAQAKNASIVFEAIVEDVEAKIHLFTTLAKAKQRDQYYFSNTSSIPISFLNEASHLDKRLIGFHFYNPPAVQKVIELVAPPKTISELTELAINLAKKLDKTVVKAHDVAGFIGNGFLMRELLFACQQVREISSQFHLSQAEAIYLINRITQEYLLRPMGIFQLMDYVGLEVCQNIAKIMREHLPDANMQDELLDSMVSLGLQGGQYSNGSQKNGILQYENNQVTGVYSAQNHCYRSISEEKWSQPLIQKLGKLPNGYASWKALQSDRKKEEKIRIYLKNLYNSEELGAKIAKAFLAHGQDVAMYLVETGVTDRIEDVETVLQLGFFHLYGLKELPEL